MSLFESTSQILMALGVALVVVDVVAFGFATFFLTIIGLSLLLAGLAVNFGLIAEQWQNHHSICRDIFNIISCGVMATVKTITK